MKKLLTTLLIAITFVVNAQNEVQVVIAEMNTKVTVGYDTIYSIKIQPQVFEELDSLSLNNEYKNFFEDVVLNYCDTVKRFVVQATVKQSGTEPRIIITKPNGDIVLVNYSALTTDRKIKYTIFVNKIYGTI